MNIPDPIGPMTAAMAQMHEMYVSYQEAGFTKMEAMQLLAVFVAETTRMAQVPCPHCGKTPGETNG